MVTESQKFAVYLHEYLEITVYLHVYLKRAWDVSRVLIGL